MNKFYIFGCAALISTMVYGETSESGDEDVYGLRDLFAEPEAPSKKENAIVEEKAEPKRKRSRSDSKIERIKANPEKLKKAIDRITKRTDERKAKLADSEQKIESLNKENRKLREIVTSAEKRLAVLSAINNDTKADVKS